MPIFIPFLIKGAIVAGKAIIAAKKATVVAKAATALSHTYGTGAVVSAGATICVTIGGIVWTAERVEDITKSYKAWENGDYKSLKSHLTTLYSKLNTLGHNSVLDSATQLLAQNGHNISNVGKFIKDVRDLINEIDRETNRPALI